VLMSNRLRAVLTSDQPRAKARAYEQSAEGCAYE